MKFSETNQFIIKRKTCPVDTDELSSAFEKETHFLSISDSSYALKIVTGMFMGLALLKIP